MSELTESEVIELSLQLGQPLLRNGSGDYTSVHVTGFSLTVLLVRRNAPTALHLRSKEWYFERWEPAACYQEAGFRVAFAAIYKRR